LSVVRCQFHWPFPPLPDTFITDNEQLTTDN
jgi:hypothetical protein